MTRCSFKFRDNSFVHKTCNFYLIYILQRSSNFTTLLPVLQMILLRVRQMKAIEDVSEFISFLTVVINTLLCQSCTISLVVREHCRRLLGLDLPRFLLDRQSLVHLCQSGEPTVFANLQIDMGSGSLLNSWEVNVFI